MDTTGSSSDKEWILRMYGQDYLLCMLLEHAMFWFEILLKFIVISYLTNVVHDENSYEMCFIIDRLAVSVRVLIVQP